MTKQELLNYIEKKFIEFNKDIFQNNLEMPKTLIRKVKTYLGKVSFIIKENNFTKEKQYKVRWWSFNFNVDWEKDLAVLDRTILHEMIHLYQIFNKNVKDGHKGSFIKYAELVKEKTGIEVIVKAKQSNLNLNLKTMEVYQVMVNENDTCILISNKFDIEEIKEKLETHNKAVGTYFFINQITKVYYPCICDVAKNLDLNTLAKNRYTMSKLEKINI